MVVEILTEKLERRLSSVGLFGRHVEIIDKDETASTRRRTVDTFLASIQSTECQILDRSNISINLFDFGMDKFQFYTWIMAADV